MNKKIRRCLFRLGLFVVCGLALAAMLAFPVSSHSVAPQQVTGFLSAPYYGSTWVSSIFDHDTRARYILALTGVVADRDSCPCIAPQPCPHPTFASAYYSCVINDYLYYNGHNGIDYVLRYDYVRAAAPGTVARANWANVDHRVSYGLHIRIDHDINGDHNTDYQTIYGHMSVLRVQMGDEISAGADEFARIIGISGNTGGSSGPHLHFEVRNANGDAVDPYGPDRNPEHKLWIEQPSIDTHVIYTSGNRPLTAPPLAENESGYVTVDDGDTDYSETAGCWTEDDTAGWAGDHRYRDVPGSDCTATWNFPSSQTAGRYHVFVHIPNDNVAPGNRRATVDAARYAIRHTVSPSQPGEKQDDIAIVNQWAYPNNAYTSTWVYLCTYYFDTNQYGTDYVRLESDTLNSRAGVMAADAVRFSPVVYRTYLPPVLNAIANPDNDGNYPVSWQWADLADTYLLQEATNAAFSGAVTRYSGTGMLWTATDKAVDTYYYRVKAHNSWGDSGWSNVRQTTVLPPAGWQTIASQNFEGAFPGEWGVWDNNGTTGGEYKWGKRTCRPYAGSYSGWGVGDGADGAALACKSDYPHDADSWLSYGPFNLEDAIAGELVFKLWSYTESYNDHVSYVASVDGLHFDGGYRISGNTQGWDEVTLNLADVPNMGNLLGESHVWVAIIFASNGSVNYAEGGYVDDVVIRECFRGLCPSGNRLAPRDGAVREVSATMIRNR